MKSAFAELPMTALGLRDTIKGTPVIYLSLLYQWPVPWLMNLVIGPSRRRFLSSILDLAM
jgi:hypothetical protein